MPSLLSWVDYSSAQREDMDRLLDAFREKGTLDELGIGTIRDTFSDLLFPGTSTLHTRARYLLFVPWAITATTAHRYPAERAVDELRKIEVRLIEALRRGEPDGGVIGGEAGGNLKRMPSTLYWGATARYRMKRCGHTINQHLRFATERPTITADEGAEGPPPQIDPCFRQLPPPPPDWLKESEFTLRRQDAEFLRDTILASCPGTYLAWLIQHGIPADPFTPEPPTPWHETVTNGLPQSVARSLNHARRFSYLIAGAQILYNLLLARDKGWQDGVVDYEEQLHLWAASEETQSAAEHWDSGDFWANLAAARWRHNPATHTFIETWVVHAQAPQRLAHNRDAETLIRTRERQLKGSRSRFVNPDALAAWEGGSGMNLMTYRWREAKSLVRDLHEGLAAPDA